MSEPIPTPPEKTVIVNNTSDRLRTLVYLSLGLNALILAVLIIAGFHHHRQLHQGFSRFGDGPRGEHFRAMERGFDHRFHDFGGHKFGMNRDEEEMNGCDAGMCPAMGSGPGPGAPLMGGPGMSMMGRGEPPSPTEMTDRMVNGLTNQLSLTEEQKTKLHPIIEQQVAQMQKDMEAHRQAMQKLMEETKAKIKPILDADQQKKLEQLKPPGPPASKE